MQKPQLFTIAFAIFLVFVLFKYGKTVQKKSTDKIKSKSVDIIQSNFFDSILIEAKKNLSGKQVMRLEALENSLPDRQTGVSKLKGIQEQEEVFHQLAHFWGDSARVFEPYAWYEAEAARLVKSEKKLTFAAHLLLDNLQTDELIERRRWKALQAKDLFERSLQINPSNDSARVGLGACYIYGNISASPMEGIGKIKEVVDRDSTNIFAQLTLAKGSLISGQYDKAISRLETVNRIEPENLEPIMLMADLYEKLGKKQLAINWYQKSLNYIKRSDIRSEVEKRIKYLN